jgi:GntR family transcriptional regulator, rspAB operon transcriptional repressor
VDEHVAATDLRRRAPEGAGIGQVAGDLTAPIDHHGAAPGLPQRRDDRAADRARPAGDDGDPLLGYAGKLAEGPTSAGGTLGHMSVIREGPARRDNVEQVHRRVREAILEGEIEPGTVMSQVALADELGVSRTPLREALRMLQSEGLVDAQANRRVTVKPVSAGDLEELVVMRVALETEAIRLSVGRLGPEDIAALEGRLAEMAHFAAAKDYARWQGPHNAFHRGLTAAAGPRVNALLGQLSDHFERYRRMHIARSPKAWLTEGHREILDAFKAGRREESAALLADHLSRTALDLFELLEPGYEPARLRQTLADVRGHPRRKKR